MAVYEPQFYESEESRNTPFANVENVELWRGGGTLEKEGQAVELCKRWMREGIYKTCRILRRNDDETEEVVWSSLHQGLIDMLAEHPLNKVLGQEAEKGSSGVPGYTVKVHVWANKELGPPDHWDLSQLMELFGNDGNGWEMIYGREVDHNRHQILWSIKIDVYPVSKKHPAKWAWHQVFNKPNRLAYEVELLRVYDRPPRTFPSGEPTNDCHECGRTHLMKASWMGYDAEVQELLPFCSCFCIDAHEDCGYVAYRTDPSGIEYEADEHEIACPVHAAMHEKERVHMIVVAKKEAKEAAKVTA